MLSNKLFNLIMYCHLKVICFLKLICYLTQ